MRTIRRSFSSILNLLFLFFVISFTSCESEKENITYRIDVISGEGGTATSSHKEIMEGWEVKLTAIAEDNYRFVNWTVNGKEVSTSNPYTATITAHTQFRANFEKDNYKVTIKAGEGGSAKATPEGEVLKGTKVTFTAIPQDGYGFANWTVNGKVVSTSNPYIATITKDIEIHANFITHKVVVIAGEGGTAKTSNTTVGHNEETTLTAIPYEGYQFLSWTVNGKVVSKNRTFTTSITADTEFVANFIKIITKINGGGLVKTTSNTNGTITLSAIPDESYQFLNWTINGKEVSKNRTFTTSITTDTEFVANFIKIMTKINGEGVVKTVSNINGTITLSATPNEGYQFLNWTINGEEVSKNRTYTTNITADTEFVANFIMVSVKANGKGSVNISINTDGSVTIYAIANKEHIFINWTINDKEISKESSYTTSLSNDTEFIANFKECIENGHKFVDLGLSVKWASCNVGATVPEEYGDYFAWGETETKTIYNEDTYKYYNEGKFTKYRNSNDTLKLEDDAAHVNWGGSWRMPTYEELKELKDSDNCIWEWTTQNGIKGCKITSKKNGNFIFLPSAGYKFNEETRDEKTIGEYWSSTLSSLSSSYAFGLTCGWSGDTEFKNIYINSFRKDGQSVRAVCP